MSLATRKSLENWQRIRAEALSSEVATKALQVVSREQPKSMNRICKEAGLEFHSLTNALRKLEKNNIITKSEESKRKRKRTQPLNYIWTYLGVLLFPDLASDETIDSFFSEVFGGYKEVVDHVCKQLELSPEDSTFVLEKLVRRLRYELMNWLREEVIFRREELPDLNDREFYRQQILNFITYSVTVNLQMTLKGLTRSDSTRAILIGMKVLDYQRTLLGNFLTDEVQPQEGQQTNEEEKRIYA